MRARSYVKRHLLTMLSIGLLASFLFAWWQSSRYSERHLVYLGNWTVEVFSASSLLRISLVRGHIPKFGANTNYRQRNSRGRFSLRPPVPEFRSRQEMWELTLGYWHLVGCIAATTVCVGFLESQKAAGRN